MVPHRRADRLELDAAPGQEAVQPVRHYGDQVGDVFFAALQVISSIVTAVSRRWHHHSSVTQASGWFSSGGLQAVFRPAAVMLMLNFKRFNPRTAKKLSAPTCKSNDSRS